MPLEGHWQRVNTPLRRLTARERWVTIAVLAVTATALLGLILATGGDSRPQPQRGCIHVVVAGRVGGEVVAGCGAEARSICAHSARFHDPRAREVAEHCRVAGIEAGPASGSS
jgi:hypothetical protein